jgi:malonyl-CoA O-methyltransferase
MLSEARRKPGADLVDFLPHDLSEALPFAESEFDLVVSGLVLEHLDDLELFFSEIDRVVKPDARTIVSAMHPAMFLRGSQVRFTDPVSGDLVRPGSVDHKLGDMIMAAAKTDFELRSIDEHSTDATFIEQFDMKATSINWPMVVVIELCRTE